MAAKIRALDQFLREGTPEQIDKMMTGAIQQMAKAGKLPAIFPSSLEDAIHQMPPDMLDVMSQGTDYLGDLLKRQDEPDHQP